jgi:membrane fusion protein, multidrug efflux system
MQKILLMLLLLSGIGSAGWWGLEWWQEGRFIETTDNATLVADMVALSPKRAGAVVAVMVANNEPVKAGTLLVRLDGRELEDEISLAGAAVETARSVLAGAEIRVGAQQSQIDQAQAVLESTKAEVKRAKADWQRMQPLANALYVSRQRLETSQADLGKANAGQANAEAGLALAVAELRVLENMLAQARARLQEATLKLADLDHRRADLEVRAPQDGVIGNKAVEVGAYIRPGQTMMTLVPLEALYVVANFKETQLHALHPGQKAVVRVDAFPEKPLQGIIQSIAPAGGASFSLLPPENATGNFTKVVQRLPIKIILQDKDAWPALLRPGLSVEVGVDRRDLGTGGGF